MLGNRNIRYRDMMADLTELAEEIIELLIKEEIGGYEYDGIFSKSGRINRNQYEEISYKIVELIEEKDSYKKRT